MQRSKRTTILLATMATTALLAGCNVEVNRAGDSAAVQPPPTQTPPAAQTMPLPTDTGAAAAAAAATPQPSADMRIEVDLAARKLYVFRGQQPADTHSVAVGSEEWPTQTGEWTIKQVVWNPEWVPPDESWAEEREPRKPGDPKNPLGQAQLVYDAPRSIHGTNAPSSIGKPVSHGSIRMRNAEIVELAEQVMTAGGAAKDDAWIRRTRENRTEKQIVDLPRPVPIRVY